MNCVRLFEYCDEFIIAKNLHNDKSFAEKSPMKTEKRPSGSTQALSDHFLKLSFRETARLNTSAPGLESRLSTQK